MTSRSSNFSDIIQRASLSCVIHRNSSRSGNEVLEVDEDWGSLAVGEWERKSKMMEEEEEEARIEKKLRRAEALETLMINVFEAIKDMKRAYASFQEAHCPFDADRIRASDSVMIGLFRKLAAIRERTKHGHNISRVEICFCGRGVLTKELVAPYEATIEELKREMKAKETEIEILQERIGKTVGRSSRRKLGCSSLGYSVPPSPGVEMLEVAMGKFHESSKAFTGVLLMLMREARWDVVAAVRSIEAAMGSVDVATAGRVDVRHAKYALESYVSRKMFAGFDHESFYMEGGLRSLKNPREFRRDCWTQYGDMRGMEAAGLLGIEPGCEFGKFCGKKYAEMVHPIMEESLFGNLEQREMVMEGKHPRSEFYKDFLGLAKAVWLLHLLALSQEPSPVLFQAIRGAQFNPTLMESIVKFSGTHVPASQVVAFPVSPGFKVSNSSVVKARVFLVSTT